MNSAKLQNLFLTYFKSHNHPVIPSSSVVPYNDNSLLFVNSGMVQFKKLFSESQSTLPYTTATSSQHCIRAGGKHNDLDDVGKDSYHHTFFFMLGNWSFGDYFKERAIFYAYDFLINTLHFNKERLYVSYYKTESSCDTETYNLWKLYVPETRILPFDEKDNFWEMGDTGPCGPCTEIHYDCREEMGDATHLVNMDHPDVIEIWNIVFIQYYRNQDRSLSTLPMKCIDTGMGMERVLRIVNGLGSNYMTDSFCKIINVVENEMRKKLDCKNHCENEINITTNDNQKYNTKMDIEKCGYENFSGNENDGLNTNDTNDKINEMKRGVLHKRDNSDINDTNDNKNNEIKSIDKERINNKNRDTQYNLQSSVETQNSETLVSNLIQDCYITSKFILYKDVYDPKNESFKHSMAMRVIADHSRTIAVCLKDGVTFSSDGRGYVLRRIMRRAIKYCNELGLANKMSLFVKVAAQSIAIILSAKNLISVENEEKLFLKTLEKGKKILLKQKSVLSGSDAFMLYDTFGFPFDLTVIYCEENNIEVDKQGFEKIKNEMREKSRKKEAKKEDLSFDSVNFLRKFEPTKDIYKYIHDKMDAKLLCAIKNNVIIYDNSNICNTKQYEDIRKQIVEVDDGEIVYLLFDKTCFYSESGGQVGDTGRIEHENGVLEVLDTQKHSNYVIHKCKSSKTTLNLTKHYNMKLLVDAARRKKIKKNHTATHLLNYALRRNFSGIEQKGSLVDDKKLRFDFTHNKGLSLNELKTIETLINQMISDKLPVIANEINFIDVKDNVVYLKEEKYPERVRVINVENKSAELCGGTHVKNTSEITKFKIISEGSISHNIRRIIAFTEKEAIMAEENLANDNPLDLEIPLIDKLLLIELQKEKEKKKQTLRKKILNDNIIRLKNEYKDGNDTDIRCQNIGFIFQCDFDGLDSKLVTKDLNMLGGVLDKEKNLGLLYVVIGNDVYFVARGDGALERGKLFCNELKDGCVNGKDKCANGKGKLK